MSSDKTPPGFPGGTVPTFEEGPAKAPSQPTTETLNVRWKRLRNDYHVLATEDGKAAGWACRELDGFGYERFRYGVGGLKSDAKSMAEAKSLVVARLAQSARAVGMVLKLVRVGREG